MAGSWGDSVAMILFIAGVWITGNFCKHILLPPIIGEILVGVILGPKVANFVPFVDVSASSAFSALGNIGTALLLAHSGLHTDLVTLKKIGGKGVMIGVLGTIAPVALGTLFFWVFGYDLYPSALVSAIAIAPASVGVSMRVLISFNRINSEFGQAILAGALVDDFLAIILLIVVKTVIAKEPSIEDTAIPLIGVVVFMVVTLLLMFTILPFVIKKLIGYGKHITTEDTIHIVLMIFFIVGYSWITSLMGSFLLGAFMAGFTFIRVRRSILLWRREIKPYMSWLIRLFFSATIAFEIPIDVMFSWQEFWRGSLLSIVCVVSKLVASLHMGNTKWIIGWAIVSRGEVSFLITEFIFSELLINPKEYAVILWGVVISMLVGPLMFQYLLRKNKSSIPISDVGNSYQIIVEGGHYDGIHAELLGIVRDFGFLVDDVTIEGDGSTDYDAMLIHKEGGQLDAGDISSLKKEIEDALDDDNVKILFRPATKITSGDLSIHVTGDNIRDVMGDLTEYLDSELNLGYFENKDACNREGNIDFFAIGTRGDTKVQRSQLDMIRERIRTICMLKDPNCVVSVKLDIDHKGWEFMGV